MNHKLKAITEKEKKTTFKEIELLIKTAMNC